jgi:hypothetical protein
LETYAPFQQPYLGLVQVEEENEALRMKVEALTNGWRRTLENIDIRYQLADFEYCDVGSTDRAY